jgi:DNA-binding GntR family transcriptional regulator
MNTASTTAVDGVVAALRKALQRGRWAPGTALRQEDLADEFGVSRIPIREALARLQSEGLLVVEPNRGAFVPVLTAAELDEIFDLRVLLETDALSHAVARHTPRTLRQLEALQRELDAEDDPGEWLGLDTAFHKALYAPSGRKRTLEAIAALRAAVSRFYLAYLSPSTRRESWNAEHHALIEALRLADAERACVALIEHLRASQSRALAVLEGER